MKIKQFIIFIAFTSSSNCYGEPIAATQNMSPLLNIVQKTKPDYCYTVLKKKDFDRDGHEDLLLLEDAACGGNCCPYQLILVSGKNKKITELTSNGFYEEPIIFFNDKLKSWIVKVIEINLNTQKKYTALYNLSSTKRLEYKTINNTNIHKYTQLIDVESLAKEAEVTKKPFLDKLIHVDLSGNGELTEFTISYNFVKNNFSISYEYDNEIKILGYLCSKLSIYQHKTNGFFDLKCDDETLIWNGNKYTAHL